MILSYCPKKNYVVTLLSSMHSQPSVDQTSISKKPEVILFYNKTKGGVDTLDQMARTYSCKRMTRRWPLVIFYNMLNISAINAFIIGKQLGLESAKKGRRKFLIQLAKELAGVNTVSKDVNEAPVTPGPSQKKRSLQYLWF